MAISQTMSNPSDWIFQPYQTGFSNISAQPETPPITITSTATAGSRNNNLTPDQGRISKPIRRRSRASRRTPTTLLNTDTTNFRAMVQQFTGGPTTPFAARPHLPSGGATLNFMEHVANTNAAAAPASGFRVQYPNQVQQQHMFMIDGMHGGGGGGAGGGVGGGGGGLSSHAPPLGSSENRNYDNYML